MTLAATLAPVILLDSREPFPFTDVAVTMLAPGSVSPSTGNTLDGPGDVVIEYALWVDMEIGHAYELEHVWVFADRRGRVVAVHGSAHGVSRIMATPPPGERPVVYSEPGKHGMAPSHRDYAISQDLVNTLCGAGAGTMGVLRPLDGDDLGCTVAEYRQAWNRLRAVRFAPAWDAGFRLDTRDLRWCTWSQLADVRGPRALAAAAGAPSDPVQVPVGTWGGEKDAWLGIVAYAGEGLLLGGMPIERAFAQAQQHARLVIAVADNASTVDAVTKSAWDCYASAHTFLACPQPAKVDRPASIAVPAAHARGTAQLVVSEVPREDFLTLGPGGDLDCPMELLWRNDWPTDTRR